MLLEGGNAVPTARPWTLSSGLVLPSWASRKGDGITRDRSQGRVWMAGRNWSPGGGYLSVVGMTALAQGPESGGAKKGTNWEDAQEVEASGLGKPDRAASNKCPALCSVHAGQDPVQNQGGVHGLCGALVRGTGFAALLSALATAGAGHGKQPLGKWSTQQASGTSVCS